MVASADQAAFEAPKAGLPKLWAFCRRHPTVVGGVLVIAIVAVTAFIAPYVTLDPLEIDPINRLQGPFTEYTFGCFPWSMW